MTGKKKIFIVSSIIIVTILVYSFASYAGVVSVDVGTDNTEKGCFFFPFVYVRVAPVGWSWSYQFNGGGGYYNNYTIGQRQPSGDQYTIGQRQNNQNQYNIGGKENGNVNVVAPGTNVNVQYTVPNVGINTYPSPSQVSVQAPFTNVDVNHNNGVRVLAPFTNVQVSPNGNGNVTTPWGSWSW